jgi:hypothetical protein
MPKKPKTTQTLDRQAGSACWKNLLRPEHPYTVIGLKLDDGRLDPLQGERRGHLAQADKSITL